MPPASMRQRQLSQGSLKEYATEIADSQPEQNIAIPAFSSPTRILQLYLQQIQSSGEQSSSSYEGAGNHSRPSPKLPVASKPARSRPTQNEGSSSASNLPSSPSPSKRVQRLPPRASILCNSDTPSTQDPAISSKRKWPEGSLEDTYMSSSAPMRLAIEGSTVTTRTTRSRKKQRANGSVNEITKTREVTSSRVTMVTTSSAPVLEASSIWAGRTEIHPPAPKASTGDIFPEMFITPALQQIVQKMPLKAVFKPQRQTRDLRPMERGYWSVKCETWDPMVRKRCWEFLGNFVAKGLGGWGIWCTRNEELDILRLYCWGTMVGYAYMLLYVASESRIKGTSASWLDGDGEALITMPS
jgi:hypothetical protein